MAAEVVVILPARLGSTRLARKLLLELGGATVLEQTWRRAREAQVGEVVIAGDDEQMAQAAQGFGARYIATDPALPSGTMRCAAAAQALGLADDTLVVNLQADEPYMPAANIQVVAQEHPASGADIQSLAELVPPGTEDWRQCAESPGHVKVVTNGAGRALYFSRAAIPWPRESAEALPLQRHLGIYGMAAARLRDFSRLPPSPLERCESLEQLRALEAGWSIAIARAPAPAPTSLDTAEDLRVLRGLQPPAG